MTDSHDKKINEIRRIYEKRWMQMDGVVSVGLGLVEEVKGIVVTADHNHQDIRDKIPLQIDGIKIDVRKVGMVYTHH